MMLYSFALVAAVLVTSTSLVSATAHRYSAKDRLTRDLLHGYQTSVDPGNIELEFGVADICSRYEKLTGTVVSSVWEQFTWKDSRLTWSPSEYAGLENIRVDSKLIWKPDFRNYNSITSFVERDDVNAVIYSDGKVLWIPRATYRTLCETGADEITCKWKLGSWTYDGNNVALKAFGKELFDLTYYDPVCPAVISGQTAEIVSHKYPCCEERYPSLDVTFKLKPRDGGKFPTSGKSEL